MSATKTDEKSTAEARARIKALAPKRAKVMTAYRDMIDETVAVVNDAYLDGVPVIDMAEEFGVDRQQVYKWLGRK